MSERKRTTYDGPQQVTRIPPYRPGHWVKVKDYAPGDYGSQSGRILRVKSLTCSINSPDQKWAVWRCHFDDGRCLEWHLIERVATAAEVAQATPGRRAA